MIAAALMIAAATPATAVDAERAFAADAQAMGQWTAFRKWADPTAVMYNPQAVWAHDFLKDRKDPPQSVRWQPTQSWVSCDGRTAVNTGPWQSAAGTGYFTTLWMRQRSGDWRWTVDGGDTLKSPLAIPRQPTVRRASCRGRPALNARLGAPVEAMRLPGRPPEDAGYSRSADGTLIYQWKVATDGARTTTVQLWNGRRFDTVLRQEVAAPPAPPTP